MATQEPSDTPIRACTDFAIIYRQLISIKKYISCTNFRNTLETGYKNTYIPEENGLISGLFIYAIHTVDKLNILIAGLFLYPVSSVLK